MVLTAVPFGAITALAEDDVQAKNPILHYTFDDEAKDTAGSNHGVVNNVTIAEGIATFAGDKNSDIKINAPVMKHENVTVSTMIKVDEQPARWATLWEAYSNNGNQLVRFAIDNDGGKDVVSQFRTIKEDGSGNAYKLASGNTKMPVGEWTEITVVQSGDTAILYMNGEKCSEVSKPDVPMLFSDLQDEGVTWIGKDAKWNDATFKGQMSDFRVYDSALSAEEVAALYAENLKEFEKPVDPPTPPAPVEKPEIENLKAHYDFSDDYHKVLDKSGNGNDAIAVGNDVILDNGMAIFRGARKTGLIDLPASVLRSENLTLTTLVYVDEAETWGSLLEVSRPDATEGETTTKYQVLKWMPKTGNDNGDCLSMTVIGTDGQERRVADQTTQMPVKQWVQLSFVLEGNQASLYLNGQKLETKYLNNNVDSGETGTTFSPAELTDGHRFVLGGGRYWPDPALKGAIADFQIYDRALTAEEIGQIAAYNLASDEATATVRQNPNALVDIDMDSIIGVTMPNGGTGGNLYNGKVYYTNEDEGNRTYRMTYGNGMYYTNRDTEWGTGMTFSGDGNKAIAQNVKTINVMVNPEKNDWGKIWDMGRNEWSGKREFVRMTWNQSFKDGKALKIAMQLCEKGNTVAKETNYWAVNADDTPLNLTMNEWSMVTFTMDETGFALYIDGQPIKLEKEVKTGEAIDGGTFATLLDNPTMSFGGTVSDFQEGFQGWYSHVSMYDKVLSADEVAALYDAVPKKTYEDLVKAYTYGLCFEWDDLKQNYDTTPWMNGLNVGQWMTNVQAVGDTLLYYYANNQRLDERLSGSKDGRRRLEKQDGAPGVEFDGNGSIVTNLNAPKYWNQPDRLWANITVPFHGVAFANNSYFSQIGTIINLTDSFVVDGQRYMVSWSKTAHFDDSIERVQKKYLTTDGDTPEMTIEDVYPGSGLDTDAKMNAFRYVYAMYNHANRGATMAESKYVGYPMANVVQLDDVVYQAYKSADGINYIAIAAENLDTAFDMTKGTAQNVYMLTGNVARALESLGADAEEAFTEAGAPTGEAVTVDGVTTQEFTNGTLKIKEDGSYSFITLADLEEVAAVEAKITAAADIANIATLDDLKAKITEAEEAYEALSSDELREMVSNYATIATLNENVTKVEAVETAIGKLPEADTIVDEATAQAADPDVTAAEAAAAALGKYEKFVPSAQKLLDLRIAIRKYVKSDELVAAEELIDAIGVIPDDNTTYKSAPAVYAAKAAYDALSVADQAAMDATKKAALEAAVTKMEELAESVKETIYGNVSDDTNRWDNSMDPGVWMNANKHTTDEQKQAVLNAMRDEGLFQYAHEGYDMGLIGGGNTVQPQEGLLYIELGGGDHTPGCNPWSQDGRTWGAIVAPYDGIAFSIKSPFGYMGTRQHMLLGNTFSYKGNVYQLTWNGVHYYAEGQTGKSDVKTEENYPGLGDTAEDITNNTFRYAAARYNQEVKWDGKTVGIPVGAAVAGEGVVYQQFEGPNGEAYIIGDANAIAAASKEEPTKAAYVVTGEYLEAIKAVDADMAAALAITGAPDGEIAEDGRWNFTKGYIKDGMFTAFSNIEIVEQLIAKVSAEEIAEKTVYDSVKSAYDIAKAAYDELSEAEQGEVSNAANLEAALAALSKFEEREAAAKAMKDVLKDLPYAVKDIDEAAREAIAQARVDYDALDEITQNLVTAEYASYLTEAENTVAAADVVVLYEKAPKDYETAWAELDPDTYEDSEEYTTIVKPLDDAYKALNAEAVTKLREIDKGVTLQAIEDLIIWRPGPVDDVVLGDLNKDGNVTIQDVMEACKVLARQSAGKAPTADEMNRGDMNKDGQFTITDVMEICKVLARQSAAQ